MTEFGVCRSPCLNIGESVTQNQNKGFCKEMVLIIFAHLRTFIFFKMSLKDKNSTLLYFCDFNHILIFITKFCILNNIFKFFYRKAILVWSYYTAGVIAMNLI